MAAFDIKIPNITATTERGQLEQIRGYLYQLADQLKWALNSLENGSQTTQVVKSSKETEMSENEATALFNEMKPLIIRSADIVEAYSEEIKKSLKGEYVAQSDFGTYVESTVQTINADSKNVEALFTSVQEIISDIKVLSNLIEVTANIRSGILEYDENGVPIYGLEVGQKNKIDGKEVFNKYARFTSDRLSFYDKNDIEVAYISDYKLYITNAQISGTLTLGRFECDSSDGLAIRWV